MKPTGAETTDEVKAATKEDGGSEESMASVKAVLNNEFNSQVAAFREEVQGLARDLQAGIVNELRITFRESEEAAKALTRDVQTSVVNDLREVCREFLLPPALLRFLED